jgi:hypothetical protein
MGIFERRNKDDDTEEIQDGRGKMSLETILK